MAIMRLTSGVRVLTVVCLAGVAAGSLALAEDTKGRWQFGFGLSYYATTDFIRSNADIAIASEVIGETGLPPVVFVDERPDDNILNEPSIDDDFKLDFSVSYGMTRWFALEVAASFIESSVGNIEIFFDDFTRAAGDGSQAPNTGCGPTVTGNCYSYNPPLPFRFRDNRFIPVGEITKIPIQLSGLVRFRPESPFDPYVGLGIGYIFADVTADAEFQAESDEITSRGILVECGGEFSFCGDTQTRKESFPGFTPGPLTVEVDDAFEWHAIAGVDYYFNEAFSMYVDARYVFTSGQIDIRADGFHQVLLTAIDDGRLVRFEQRVYDEAVGVFPDDALFGQPYFWEDQGPLANAAFHSRCPECRGSGFFETEDKDGNGLFDASEDDGILYVLPPGSIDPSERLDEITCTSCVGNGPGPEYPGQDGFFLHQDTEDVNFSRSLDRFLAYGVDICTTPEGVGSTACAQTGLTPSSPDQYVLPSGCGSTAPPITSRAPEGCPPPLTNVSFTGTDDTTDQITVQGGEINLGGFSLGVGFKFSF